MKSFKYSITAAAAALALGFSGTTLADTAIATGTAAASGGAGAAVDLQFQIVIPQFISFRVGSTGTTVDTIEFDPTVADVLGAATTTATTGGDVSPGIVTVQLISNAGGVTITPTNDGGGSGLPNGSGDFIDYAQIATSSVGGFITPPTLTNAGGVGVPVPPTAGSVTVANDQWEYEYNNPATPPAPGTYTGTVTYTAAIP